MTTTGIKVLVTILVIAHLAGNFWHGDAHAILEIALPNIKMLFVVVVILAAPVLGAILTWTRFALPGYWIVALSCVGSVVFSVYHHFILISIDNVAHLPAGAPEAHAHFSDSAEFIALAALAAALAAFYAAGKVSTRETNVA